MVRRCGVMVGKAAHSYHHTSISVYLVAVAAIAALFYNSCQVRDCQIHSLCCDLSLSAQHFIIQIIDRAIRVVAFHWRALWNQDCCMRCIHAFEDCQLVRPFTHSSAQRVSDCLAYHCIGSCCFVMRTEQEANIYGSMDLWLLHLKIALTSLKSWTAIGFVNSGPLYGGLFLCTLDCHRRPCTVNAGEW